MPIETDGEAVLVPCSSTLCTCPTCGAVGSAGSSGARVERMLVSVGLAEAEERLGHELAAQGDTGEGRGAVPWSITNYVLKIDTYYQITDIWYIVLLII